MSTEATMYRPDCYGPDPSEGSGASERAGHVHVWWR